MNISKAFFPIRALENIRVVGSSLFEVIRSDEFISEQKYFNNFWVSANMDMPIKYGPLDRHIGTNLSRPF